MPYEFSQLADKIKRHQDDSGLAMEAAIARTLLEAAVENGNYGLANALLQTVQKLTTAEIQNDLRSAKALPAASVLFISRSLMQCVFKRLEERGIPAEDILENLMSDVDVLFKQVRERQLLTCDKPKE